MVNLHRTRIDFKYLAYLANRVEIYSCSLSARVKKITGIMYSITGLLTNQIILKPKGLEKQSLRNDTSHT